MKKIRVLVTMLTAAALLVLLPGGSTLKAEAAEAKNYAVKYCPDEGDGEWRYQEGSVFDEEEDDRELYYLLQDLKAGDKIAVYNGDATAPALDLGSVKLGNVTICHTAMTVVHTGGVSECYVLAASACSVSGDIDTAHVYDVATATFAGNVNELIVTAEGESLGSNVGCSGQVGHLYARSDNYHKTFYNLYSFDKDTLDISEGRLKTDSSHYEKTEPAASNTQASNTAVATPAPTAAPSSGEYDDVPKTGEGNLIFWFLAASVLCFTGSLVLREKSN